MSDIPHVCVADHECRLEDIEEPLIPDLKREHIGVHAHSVMKVDGPEIFDVPVDRPDLNQRSADVQRHQCIIDVSIMYSGLATAAVERCRQEDEEVDDDHLKDQGGLHQGLARILHRL